MTKFCLWVLVALTVSACGSSERVAAQPPAQTDSLVKLMRKSLHEPDPVPTALAMMCQIHHLFQTHEEREAVRLVREAQKFAYRNWQDRRARDRRDAKLANHTFPGDERACTMDPDSTRPLYPAPP